MEWRRRVHTWRKRNYQVRMQMVSQLFDRKSMHDVFLTLLINILFKILYFIFAIVLPIRFLFVQCVWMFEFRLYVYVAHLFLCLFPTGELFFVRNACARVVLVICNSLLHTSSFSSSSSPSYSVTFHCGQLNIHIRCFV